MAAFLAAPALPARVASAHPACATCSLRALPAVALAALLLGAPALALDDARPALKVSGGSASTAAGGARGGRTVIKTVTRGIVLEGADFSGTEFEGVSFQQSILRQADFTGAKLRDASFFDADLSGAIFRDADLRGVNFELANLRGADLTNADLTNAYLSSTTKFNNAVIEGSDWTDTLLRKDQQAYLCSIASGTNPATGVETRESLVCPVE